MSNRKPNITRSQRNKLRELARFYHKQLEKGIIPVNIDTGFLLQELKYKLTRTQADNVLEKLDDDKFAEIISNPIAKTYSELSPSPSVLISSLSIEKDFNWVSKFIKDYSSEINKFLVLEKEYESYLLNGHYNNAKSLLSKIENEITVSAWSIQQKLFVAELEKGFKANKDILSAILTGENSIIVNFISNYTSIRIERNISSSQFESMVKTYLSRVDKTLESYIGFKVSFFRSFSYANVAPILMFDSTLSIIDRYKTFIQLSQILLSKPHTSDKISNTIIRNIKEFSSDIDDIDLINLLHVQESYLLNDEDIAFIKLVDAYTSSDYRFVVKTFGTFIKSNTRCFPAILIYCKALTCLGLPHIRINNINTSLLDQIIELILIILDKGDEFSSESYSDLYKIAHFLGCHPLAIGIFKFLGDELPFKLDSDKEISILKLTILNSKIINPALHQFLSIKEKKLFLKKIKTSVVDSSTVDLIAQLSQFNLKEKIDLEESSSRELKYFAIVLKLRGQFNEALKINTYVLEERKFQNELRVKHIKLDFIVEKFRCLIHLERFEEALELATESVMSDKNCVSLFYHPHFLNILIETNNSQILGNICLPIFLKFYETEIEFYHIYVAYDNFLCSVNCETPADFIKIEESRSNKGIFFLDKVCRHEILHSSPYFKDQEELDLARIQICDVLNSLYQDTKPFEAEMSDLLRKILVRKGIKQIDYSKIYVDVKGLKATLQKDLRESFNRNIEIASLPPDQINKIVESVGNLLVYYIENVESQDKNNADPDDIANFKLTSYNRFLHFKEAFLKIRDKFISSTDHGLDTYVSMRIRHGTLLGQIRSVFESHNLITVLSQSQNEYLPNEFWLGRLSFLNEERKLKLTNAFNHFSGSIDQIAEELKSATIQVKTESKGSVGLFDYTYTEQVLLSLFSHKFGYIRDYDVFVDKVIEELWNKTEECLENIRGYLNSTFIELIDQKLSLLEQTIEEINPGGIFYTSPEISELIQKIRSCKTAISVEMHKISEWFKRSNQKIIEEFDFSLLIDSSITTFQKIYPHFNRAAITIDNKCDFKFNGDFFPYFTDIFFYLLDNAIKHSKLTADNLSIEIKIEADDKSIYISVSNSVFDDNDYLHSLSKRIETTRKILRDKNPYQNINKEGGTGFAKIKKTIEQDLNRLKYDISLDLMGTELKPMFISNISFEHAHLDSENPV